MESAREREREGIQYKGCAPVVSTQTPTLKRSVWGHYGQLEGRDDNLEMTTQAETIRDYTHLLNEPKLFKSVGEMCQKEKTRTPHLE